MGKSAGEMREEVYFAKRIDNEGVRASGRSAASISRSIFRRAGRRGGGLVWPWGEVRHKLSTTTLELRTRRDSVRSARAKDLIRDAGLRTGAFLEI